MTSPRAKRKAEKSVSALADALKFIALAQHETGTTNQTHCRLANGAVTAFDGIVAAGHPIAEELAACPHSLTMLDALGKCGDVFAVSQLNENRLLISSGKFRAYVPCVPFDALGLTDPDPQLIALDDSFKAALEIVDVLISENAQTVVSATAFVRNGSVISTNRHMVIEYWHGFNLPEMLLPKSAIKAITECKKPLVGFGYSGHSATFHFEGGCWLRSQLYKDEYPIKPIDDILNTKCNAWPVPPDFFNGVRAIASFSGEGHVIFNNGKISTHGEGLESGATYDCPGVPSGLMYASKYLLLAEPHMKSVDFATNDQKAIFFGDNVRGAIQAMYIPKAAQEHTPRIIETSVGEVDADIPF